jgi:hypothetical protein
MLRFLFVVAAGLVLPWVGWAQCATTVAPVPAFVPPTPYAASALPEGEFWYGSEALWTVVDTEGQWHMEGNVLHGKGYRTKLVYWRRGFDWHAEPEPKLVVTAKRLDGDAPPATVAPHASAVFLEGNLPAMMTLIDVPVAGCWQVTGRYEGETVRFVVSVER